MRLPFLVLGRRRAHLQWILVAGEVLLLFAFLVQVREHLHRFCVCDFVILIARCALGERLQLHPVHVVDLDLFLEVVVLLATCCVDSAMCV